MLTSYSIFETGIGIAKNLDGRRRPFLRELLWAHRHLLTPGRTNASVPTRVVVGHGRRTACDRNHMVK